MMRCFLPCFRTSKRRNQLLSAPTHGGQTRVGKGSVELQKTVVEELIDCIAESKIEEETKEKPEKEPQINEKKDGREEEDDEINKRSHQEESSESLFSLSICSRKLVSDAEAEVNSPIQLVCTGEVPQAFGSSEHEVNVENIKHHEQKPNFLAAIKKGEESSSAKKLDEKDGEKGKTNHPVPGYRYRDCPDDGYDDINLDATLENDQPPNEKREGVDLDRTWVQEESSESLFSLSADSRKRISAAEVENEVNSLMSVHATQGKISDVSSVLNPIENLTHGRVVAKATMPQPLKNDKENINMDVNITVSPKPLNHKARQRSDDERREIGIDTSLSSWLVESEATPLSVNKTRSVGELTPKGRSGSPWSHENRPILGALTVEDIRFHSLSASSRRSKSRSPDETPIIGTVGSYWRHTEQTMDLVFDTSGKDVKSKTSSTAVQTRLERAFEASVAEA